jgi:hypothetical protein
MLEFSVGYMRLAYIFVTLSLLGLKEEIVSDQVKNNTSYHFFQPSAGSEMKPPT